MIALLLALALPTPDPIGERYYRLARDAWTARTDVPYVRYGARIRYEHHFRTFDDWWDVYYRSSDGEIALGRLHDAEDENRRLKGAPISIFGVTIGDTNADAEKIRVEDPKIVPTFSFGLQSSAMTFSQGGSSAQPSAAPGALKEIAVVVATTRAYDVRYVGTSQIGTVDAVHLTFTPLRDPDTDRLRELWLDPVTNRTMQLRVQGLLNGKPYSGVSWLAQYVEIDGRNYLQQIVADEPLHFGADIFVPHLEFDFFDYHFPATVPQFTFDRKPLL